MSVLNPIRKTGEYVVYKKHGVYEISEIKEERVAGETKTYYVLKSVYDANVTVYVPADKEDLVSRMEDVLTTDDIKVIVKNSKEEEVEWIDTNSERFALCEEILARENLSEILAMMRLLAKNKEEALLSKRKVFAHDERMLSASQKIISEAFAFSLGIDRKDVVRYIEEKFKT